MAPAIKAKIDAEFVPDQRDTATSMLHRLSTDLGVGDHSRVLRCVVHLAGRDLDRLELWSEQARKDWRDVIVEAELGDGPRSYRDFRKPFEVDGSYAAS